MTTNADDKPSPALTNHGHGRVAPLRGATTTSVGRAPWLVAGAFGIVVLAVIAVVSLLSATNDRARLHRLQSEGIAVAVKVVTCTGNIGGSGSTSAGYSCRGSYVVGHQSFTERVGSKTTFSPPGTILKGVADPRQPSTVVLASALKDAHVSLGSFLAPLVLALVTLALSVALGRDVIGRRRSRFAGPGGAPR
ncbi:MAG: hypothetical protein KGJ42_02840 [Acidobacteriota bacterium]|nr:hypothetical protein [Acidobacteriota bacterium]